MSLLWVQELEVRLGGKERRGMFGSEALPPAGLDLYPSPPAALSKTPVSRAARPVLPSKVCFSIYSEGLASVSLCAPSPCPGDGAGEHPLVSKGWEEMGRDGHTWKSLLAADQQPGVLTGPELQLQGPGHWSAHMVD